MNVSAFRPGLVIVPAFLFLTLPACDKHVEVEHAHHEHHTIVVTNPLSMDVDVVQPYVCQIHSRTHIDVCALENGYLEAIPVSEGQTVKKGDVLFTVNSILYKTRLDAELAEVQHAELELNNAIRLYNDKNQIVSSQEVALYRAKLAKAQAKAELTRAELNFATIRAPFDGIIDRLYQQEGSLVKEGDMLTTLSDNSVMWVYFNVPEGAYLDYMSRLNQAKDKVGADKDDKEDDDDDGNHDADGQNSTTGDTQSGVKDGVKEGVKDDIEDVDDDTSMRIELQLANNSVFSEPGKLGAIEGQFDNETGNIPFRADFSNPKGLLRHGQTGNVLIHRLLKDAIVIPQRAVFEILDKQYVYVVGEDHIVRQREIIIRHEKDDIYVIKSGLSAKDKIVLEGVRQVRDGEKVEAHFLSPEEALSNQKYHAE